MIYENDPLIRVLVDRIEELERELEIEREVTTTIIPEVPVTQIRKVADACENYTESCDLHPCPDCDLNDGR